MDNDHGEERERNPKNGVNRYITEIDKDDLKSMFYLLLGKPESYIKLFQEPLCLAPDDFIELNEQIVEKLTNHNIHAINITTTINYSESEIEQLGSWQEFINYNWKTRKETDSISIKWDFLVKIQGYEIPQRHTVHLKISNEISPIQLMRAIFSLDIDDMEKAEIDNAPMICRIDFINHILSEELMMIVENWQQSRIKKFYYSDLAKFIKKHKLTIARVIHYSIPLFVTFLSISVLLSDLIIKNSLELTVYANKLMLAIVVVSGVLIAYSYRLGKKIASKVYRGISEYGRFPIFNLTNGDKNRQDKAKHENRKSTWKIVWNIIKAILINLASTFIGFILQK